MINKNFLIFFLTKEQEKYRSDTTLGLRCIHTAQILIDALKYRPSDDFELVVDNLSLEEIKYFKQEVLTKIRDYRKSKMKKVSAIYISNSHNEKIKIGLAKTNDDLFYILNEFKKLDKSKIIGSSISFSNKLVSQEDFDDIKDVKHFDVLKILNN